MRAGEWKGRAHSSVACISGRWSVCEPSLLSLTHLHCLLLCLCFFFSFSLFPSHSFTVLYCCLSSLHQSPALRSYHVWVEDGDKKPSLSYLSLKTCELFYSQKLNSRHRDLSRACSVFDAARWGSVNLWCALRRGKASKRAWVDKSGSFFLPSTDDPLFAVLYCGRKESW